MTHKTVSKDFKLLTECFYNNSQFTAESMSDVAYMYIYVYVTYYGERKLGRPVDALALGGDEGRDKLR